MKKFLKWSAAVLIVLFVAYIAGPSPSKPVLDVPSVVLPASLQELEAQVNDSEKAVRGIRPDNEARIVWADSAVKEKTPLAILYLHGFSASQAEGEPVHRNIAKHFNANLYLARLQEHGIDRGDSTMIGLTADKYYESAERALAIASRLGNEVVVIATSAGGALGLNLASRHPEIKALVLYSPCIALFNGTATLVDNPWGLQLLRKIQGGKIMKFEAESELHAKYWMMKYRCEALVELQNLLTHTMNKETFSKVKCPLFLAYYYKNEAEQDSTVSVPAMKKMFEELGTPTGLKREMAFPESGAHVIASYIRSADWESVQSESIEFL